MRRLTTKLASRVSFIFIAMLAVIPNSIAVTEEQQGFAGLITAADSVVAVQILSTDYTATAADGPMVATAKVLKTLKGGLIAGKTFTFVETAWVGPAYQQGELRILFLEKTRPTESQQPAPWRILSNLYARTDFFIDKDSVSALSSESLKSFLRKIQQLKPKPKKVVFDTATR